MKLSEYWKKLTYTQRGFAFGVVLAILYLFVMPIYPTFHEDMFWGCNNTHLNCYLGLVSFNIIFGIPAEIGLIILSTLLGFVLGKIKDKKTPTSFGIIFILVVIAMIVFTTIIIRDKIGDDNYQTEDITIQGNGM